MSRSSVILALLVGLVIGGILSPALLRNAFPRDVVVKTDTTIVIDTNIHINPPAISIEVSITDNIIVEPADIIITDDSLIVLPMQTKTYEGEDYKCQISGYQPNLDWIEIFNKTTSITQTEYIQADWKNSLSFSAAAEYSDRFRVPVKLEYTHNFGYFQLGGYGGYDVWMKKPIVGVNTRIDFLRK